MDADQVNIRINLPYLKLELQGNPKQHLPELRKFLSEVNKLSSVDMELEEFDDLFPSLAMPFWRLSREIQKNDKVMKLLQQLAQIEEGVIVKKAAIENVNEITDKGTVSKIQLPDIKSSISGLFDDVDRQKINYLVVHVMSNIPTDHFSIIFDQVAKQVPHAKTEVVQTQKDVLGKTVIECVCFGNFPEMEE